MESKPSYREPVSSVQMVEVFVDLVGVFLQEVGVQCLHDETERVSVQLSAEELWKHLWSCGGQQLSAGHHVPAAAS